MNKLLTAYWIEFGDTLSEQVGVTAYPLEDAAFLVKQKIFTFRKEDLPPVRKIIENIQFKDPGQHHIVCNMGTMSERDAWFPNMISH